MEYYEFRTKAVANIALNKINTALKEHYKAQGFTVDNDGIIGKVNGKDNPDAQKTLFWSDISEDKTGKFIIPALNKRKDLLELDKKILRKYRFKKI